ncbi:hypothetical protein AJ80_09108 [Polytolypa hystricis UAMH7299]|uniref:Uncharacterized protein n=1 Tax=Polytolypa hystricis (strain UAMH7299) TaxID=1447883 RepID=A0A2B7WVM3_POLH7|nr:hypothetical protein AJ80_09108 [Polytolypa hystricis UAMH7299]
MSAITVGIAAITGKFARCILGQVLKNPRVNIQGYWGHGPATRRGRWTGDVGDKGGRGVAGSAEGAAEDNRGGAPNEGTGDGSRGDGLRVDKGKCGD